MDPIVGLELVPWVQRATNPSQPTHFCMHKNGRILEKEVNSNWVENTLIVLIWRAGQWRVVGGLVAVGVSYGW